MDDDFDRILLRVSFFMSLVAIAVIAYWMVTAYNATDATCDMFAGQATGQVSGQASVSWFPPGLTCTYGDDAYIDSPSYLRVVVLLVAVAGLPFTAWMRWSLRGK